MPSTPYKLLPQQEQTLHRLLTEATSAYADPATKFALLAVPCVNEGNSVGVERCNDDSANIGEIIDGKLQWPLRSTSHLGAVDFQTLGPHIFMGFDNDGKQTKRFKNFANEAGANLLACSPPWLPANWQHPPATLWIATLFFSAPTSSMTVSQKKTRSFMIDPWPASIAALRDILHPPESKSPEANDSRVMPPLPGGNANPFRDADRFISWPFNEHERLCRMAEAVNRGETSFEDYKLAREKWTTAAVRFRGNFQALRAKVSIAAHELDAEGIEDWMRRIEEHASLFPSWKLPNYPDQYKSDQFAVFLERADQSRMDHFSEHAEIINWLVSRAEEWEHRSPANAIFHEIGKLLSSVVPTLPRRADKFPTPPNQPAAEAALQSIIPTQPVPPPEKPAAKRKLHKMTKRRRRILHELLQLGATREHLSQTRDDVSKKIDKHMMGSDLGRDFSALRELGFTDSNTGPEGGVWLTEKGINEAKKT